MSRFLFVVPPLTGHVNPTVSVARELERHGHTVAWVAHPRRVRPLLPPDATLLPLDDGVDDEIWSPVLAERGQVRGLESFVFLWEKVLVPLARGMLSGVDEAIDRFLPDVLVVDHQAIAGALVARRRGLRFATLCTTSASVVEPLRELPKLQAWMDAQLATLAKEAGLPAASKPDLSPTLVIVFSVRELVGQQPFLPHYHFVGPSISDRPDETTFPWSSLRDGRRILVSLGTVSSEAGGRFYRTVVEGLRAADLQVVMVAPPTLVGEVPNNFIVSARVPQLALLPHMSAVVCHAGHNTVCESLAYGLPLVVAPIRDDQPVVARQVLDAGVGVRIKFGRATPETLRRAVLQVLDDPQFAARAAAMKIAFAQAGGAARAAALLEAMK